MFIGIVTYFNSVDRETLDKLFASDEAALEQLNPGAKKYVTLAGKYRNIKALFPCDKTEYMLEASRMFAGKSPGKYLEHTYSDAFAIIDGLIDLCNDLLARISGFSHLINPEIIQNINDVLKLALSDKTILENAKYDTPSLPDASVIDAMRTAFHKRKRAKIN